MFFRFIKPMGEQQIILIKNKERKMRLLLIKQQKNTGLKITL